MGEWQRRAMGNGDRARIWEQVRVLVEEVSTPASSPRPYLFSM